jgi:hypothetical protein
MSKLLKTMVFILLILGSVALVLASMLYSKRELVLGRTRKLERTVIALGSTIEKEPAAAESTPRYPARDISEVTSEELDSPQISSFWDNYASELELQDQPLLDLTKQRQQLMNYYKIDPVTGKPEKDIQGMKVTTGEGTMQGVLDELLGKSGEQLNRLNATRQQLVDLRVELVSTITELNASKHSQRVTLRKVEDLNSKISNLEDDITAQKEKVAELEEEKVGLDATIAEQRRTIEDDADKLAESELEIKRLKAELKKKEQFDQRAPVQASGDAAVGVNTAKFTGQIDPGEKGTVIAVNTEWNFVVVKLNDQFFNEITSDESAGIPQVTLMIKRIGEKEVFVTKARLIQVKKSEKLGVFDMLPDWQQMPVEKGDVAFY